MPEGLDPESTLQKFDRVMRLWESARSAARAAEDRYVEIAWGPTLREEARKQRRALGLSAVITLAMSAFNLSPTSIPALGLPIEGLQRLVLVGGGVAFTAYFLAEFLTYAARDFEYDWPVASCYGHSSMKKHKQKRASRASRSRHLVDCPGTVHASALYAFTVDPWTRAQETSRRRLKSVSHVAAGSPSDATVCKAARDPKSP
jgi:hypothetical protein